jgi:phosphonate transport system substrate-binding protein
MERILLTSLMADNVTGLYLALAAYLTRRLGVAVDVVRTPPWQERERMLHRGDAHLGVMCGLQYVYATEHHQRPELELLAAPVMRAPRYQDRPIYFSDVVVRQESPTRSFRDLRGATWAYNEPTSQSGYNITRYTLAVRGETGGFFGRSIASGSHERSLQLVLDGSVDASAIDSTVLEQELRVHPEHGQWLRVIETLGPSPIPPLVASRALPHERRAAVRGALLEMHRDAGGSEVLASWGLARLVPVADADYDPIRAMARMAAAVVL